MQQQGSITMNDKPSDTPTEFHDLPPDTQEEVQRRLREQQSQAGKKASHEDRVRAGRAGYAARLRNLAEKVKREKEQQEKSE